MINPVILSGGVGSRLWPVSREAFPKQFLPMASEQSMLCETLARLEGLDAAKPVLVCNDEHRFLVAEQLRSEGFAASEILLEPVGRNTAPAVAVAALRALKRDAEAVLLVLPADHLIRDEQAFHAAVVQGLSHAQADKLVTFGIIPSHPETGYGYIRRGESLDSSVSVLDEFIEKPDLASAEAYLESGEYLWNSGMFLLGAKAYLAELEQHAPEIYQACVRAEAEASHDLDFVRLGREAFEACPSDSIDYAVMEHTQDAVVVSLDCGWSDVGSWSALWDVAERDGQGNVCKGDVLVSDVRNSYLRADADGRLLAAVGIENLVVVDTRDAVLVAHRERVQDVKAIVKQLQSAVRSEATNHSRVYRPWGCYESLASAPGFQVKRITVNPGQKLSLQLHHHRAEHWIVVSGTAKVTCGDQVFTLSEDQSTYIPLGTKHRLENPGVIPLELIEVQSGNYLGEDDIVRFDDDYGRSGSNS